MSSKPPVAPPRSPSQAIPVPSRPHPLASFDASSTSEGPRTRYGSLPAPTHPSLAPPLLNLPPSPLTHDSSTSLAKNDPRSLLHKHGLSRDDSTKDTGKQGSTARVGAVGMATSAPAQTPFLAEMMAGRNTRPAAGTGGQDATVLGQSPTILGMLSGTEASMDDTISLSDDGTTGRRDSSVADPEAAHRANNELMFELS